MTKGKAVVQIERGEDRLAIARTLLERGYAGLIKPGDRVAMKINQVGGLPPARGHTVPADLVGLAVSLARQAGAREVVVGDDVGRYRDSWEVYRRLGTDEAVREAGGVLVDLRQQPHPRVPVPGGGMLVNEMEFSAPLLECDVLVGLTKPKTHHQAGTTAAIKNMFGAVPDHLKRYFHRNDLDKALVDINTVRRPDFTLVDGFPAHEGLGPHAGFPVEVGYSLAGADPVAVDAVCNALMGFGPSFTRYVGFAGARGLGVSDLSHIDVHGATIASLARPFRTALDHMREILAGTVEIGDTTGCNGCVGAVITAFMLLQRRHDKTADDFRREFAGLRVFIGEPDGAASPVDPKTILVGNCIHGQGENANFIPGCPPTAVDVVNWIAPADTRVAFFGPESMPKKN
jgi:uncharacterized protein (DUF362 family)